MSKIFFLTLFFLFTSCAAAKTERPTNGTYAKRELIGPNFEGPLAKELKAKGFTPGSEVFIRTFKRKFEAETRGPFTDRTEGIPFNSQIEIWIKKEGRFELFKSYDAAFNINEPIDGNDLFAGLGPKQKKGDKQAPEGFYEITEKDLNPDSKYNFGLFFNYPNKYDQALNRTGDFLEIHGSFKSEGCYTTSTEMMKEIYVLSEMAILKGQKKIDLHALPFPLETANLELLKKSPWYDFWINLKEGYDHFEEDKIPPKVEVRNQKYIFTSIHNKSTITQKKNINDSSRNMQKSIITETSSENSDVKTKSY